MTLSRRLGHAAATLGLAAGLGCIHTPSKDVVSPSPREETIRVVRQQAQRCLDNVLKPLISIKSVQQEGFEERREQAAEFIAEQYERAGLSARLIPLEHASSIVVGERRVERPDATIFVYTHYDTVTVESWTEGLDPFELTRVGDKWIARGGLDDKGPNSAAICAAHALTTLGTWPNIDFVLFAEGSEEGGSDEAHAEVQDGIKAIAQTLNHDAPIVAILADVTSEYLDRIVIYQATKGFAGARVTGPFDDIATLVRRTHDLTNNRILLPAFYDGVPDNPITVEVEARFGKLPASLEDVFMRPETGFSDYVHRSARPTFTPTHIGVHDETRLWNASDGELFTLTTRGPKEAVHSGGLGGPVADPALYGMHFFGWLAEQGTDYHVLSAAYGAHGLETKILPESRITFETPRGAEIERSLRQFREEYALPENLFSLEQGSGERPSPESVHSDANFTYRLVGDQDPHATLNTLEQATKGLDLTIERLFADPTFVANLDSPISRKTIQGFKDARGVQDVARLWGGGTLPLASLVEQLMGNVVMTGLAGEGTHAPNEFFYDGEIRIFSESLVHAAFNVADK